MKTNLGLVEYCEAQLGCPYWYGTFGHKASSFLFRQKKAQYPSYYTANDFIAQYGKRVYDCSGLIKGYFFCDDKNSFYNSALYDAKIDSGIDVSNCDEKGSIGTIPEIPGVLVFFTGHVGIYIGNGEVIEARGHAYGVVKTKLEDRPWKMWGKLNFLTYVVEEDDDKMVKELCEKYGEDKVKEAIETLITVLNSDNEPSEWALSELKEAVEKGITDGTKPKMYATREQVAIMVNRALKK